MKERSRYPRSSLLSNLHHWSVLLPSSFHVTTMVYPSSLTKYQAQGVSRFRFVCFPSHTANKTSTTKSKWLRVRELKMRPFEKSTNAAQTNLSRIAGSEQQHRTSLSAMRPPSRLTVQSVFFRVYEHSGARLEFSFVVPYFLRWVRILLLVKLATERKPILPPRQQVASSFITMTPIIPVPR